MKRKEIQVTAYDPHWPAAFLHEKKKILEILPKARVEHIGSTAVPGLCAKPSIDIVCGVENLKDSLFLESIGYIFKGELNIPLRYYFSNNDNEVKINLHAVENDHPFIALNILFRDYLRENDEARDAYAKLKQELIDDPSSHLKKEKEFSGYNLGKNDFIKEILKRANYAGQMVNFCMHNREWEAYHNLISDDHIVEDDFYFVIYKGVEIVGAAHVTSDKKIASIAGDLRSTLRETIKRWASLP